MKKFLLLLLIILIGCSSNKLMTYNNNNCNTVVEGYYSFPKIWNSFAPAIIFLKNNVIKYGNVIKQDTTSITFVERKSGIFHTPDTLLYSIKDIQGIIDSSKNCIYGDFPQKYSEKGMTLKIYLSRKDNLENENMFWELKPNENFAYCMEPGTYDIKKIEFIHNEGVDESISIPFSQITIEQSKTNYLGNISILPSFDINQEVFKIPFKEITSNSKTATVGALFGLVGVLIYNATKDSDNNLSGYYRITILDDIKYKPISRNEFIKKIIK